MDVDSKRRTLNFSNPEADVGDINSWKEAWHNQRKFTGIGFCGVMYAERDRRDLMRLFDVVNELTYKAARDRDRMIWEKRSNLKDVNGKRILSGDRVRRLPAEPVYKGTSMDKCVGEVFTVKALVYRHGQVLRPEYLELDGIDGSWTPSCFELVD